MSEFVIEIRSESDRLSEFQAKMGGSPMGLKSHG
jgi:hypothetical protein